jgi:penicillin-binding protein 1C
VIAARLHKRIGALMWRRQKYCLMLAAVLLLSGALVLTLWTSRDLQPLPDLGAGVAVAKPQLLDRHGRPMTVTYENRWNLHDRLALHQVPELLQTAFVLSEDKNFFAHQGVDWWARLSAAWQNLRARQVVRGASTISEQVVRMLHARPRTLWSRWLEGFEARRLESRNSKARILEWYLNQVPYAARRRGVLQAARTYFDRDPDTLSIKETLALAVMVRAPAYLDPRKNPAAVDRAVKRLALRLQKAGRLSAWQITALDREEFKSAAPAEPVDVRHFARYLYRHNGTKAPVVHTTLDLDLQRTAQQILDQQLRTLRPRHVDNAALLVVDNQQAAIRAWVVGTSPAAGDRGQDYDAVLIPRQPGSALKPFLYALALRRGWTPATMIDDSPLQESVGWGLHTYHNYSHRHYGPISLRRALANSLNIPAVRTIQYVGAENFLDTLHALGIQSLDQHPNLYGDGLALGNGEISLFELVQAYAVLARRGRFTPLRVRTDNPPTPDTRAVFSEEITSLMGHILSDAQARRLEFGDGSLLDLPVQTAVKTGTSSDYRDAWALGYNYRYTVGVWMGNLNNRSMNEVTGSSGPALVLRSVMAELTRYEDVRPLYFSRRLVQASVCNDSGLLAGGRCDRHDEWFVPGHLPASQVADAVPIRIRWPSDGLQMAMDPRIPDTEEAFEFQLNQGSAIQKVQWLLNGRLIAQTAAPTLLWPLQRGGHTLRARVWSSRQAGPVESQMVHFMVK